MAELITLEEKLISEAEFGFFYYYGKLTKKMANQLRKEGFIVTDSKETRSYPRLHKVSWSNVTINCENVYDLNENDPKYSLIEKLWIISSKNQLPIF